MSKLKRIWKAWQRPVKYAASDPENFSEKWSFTTTRFSVVSLLVILFLLIMYAALYFLSPWFVSYQGSKGIKREQLENQAKEIKDLQSAIDAQEKYISSLRLILLGEVPVSSSIDSLNDYSTAMIDSLFSQVDSASVMLEEKVRADMRTKSKGAKLSFFVAPVEGEVSQKFDEKHKGIDVVTEANTNILASLSGTVIYTGYTRKDGFIAVIAHGNNYITVYKHCKTIFKKTGDKVHIGDPLGIVGNTGENSTGPHLHFEIWQDQIAINPETLIQFKK